jgi:phospholipase C
MIRQKVLAAILTVLLGASQFGPASASAGTPPATPQSPAAQSAEPKTKTPIKHLIFVMQENHTFDNYFGTYPGADGIPANTKMPVDPANPKAGFVQPWYLGNSTITDLSHNGKTFQQQYNNGKMDGFVSALNLRKQDGRTAMGYYDQRDIPYYWNLADHYVLFDRFFSSAMNGSFVNHMYSVAAIPPQSEDPSGLSTQLNNVSTIFDRLQAAGVSWKFYVQNYDPRINYRNLQGVGSRDSQVIWVPLLDFDRFIDNPSLASHIVDLKQYYTDLQQGTLPAVAYIVPSGTSEHPPQYPASGQRFIKGLIQELMRSSSWDSSAFVMAYDDWGGWYDHVKPPRVDAYGYGLRVAALMVSPYAKEGHIDHTQLDFTSILKFIETNWGIAPLASRDAQANNILSAFDFSKPPRRAAFVPLKREAIQPVKAAPTLVIYSAYSMALLLAIVVMGIAFWRARKTNNIQDEGITTP